MQNYHLKLESEIFDTFRCQRAANSLDIDVKKKAVHEINISADLTSSYRLGLILGSSGSGKTTLAKNIFGQDCLTSEIKAEKPIIDQFDPTYSYDECAGFLVGTGLTSVPCWIRPVYTLSNGQKTRAEAALLLSSKKEIIVIDEWTSVVDRVAAKVMSQKLRKYLNSFDKKVILLSCHYDVVEWLDPDWIIDCNEQKFIDRRLLPSIERARTETLTFDVRELNGSSSWKAFSKYHYLSDRLAVGRQHFFGLFNDKTQIGFLAFSNYVPKRKHHTNFIMHFNRLVIHPDYAGLSAGLRFVNICAEFLIKKYGYRILGKFSSAPMFKACSRDSRWKLIAQDKIIGVNKSLNRNKNSSFGRTSRTKGKNTGRSNVQTYTFEYI